MSLSNYWENEIGDHLFMKGAYAALEHIYVGLCTADPTDAGTGESCNEFANSGAYARVDTVAADWNAFSGGATANANAITFPEATGNWGTATHFALFDSGTYGEGNMLAYGALTASKAIGTGDTPRFPAGELDVTID